MHNVSIKLKGLGAGLLLGYFEADIIRELLTSVKELNIEVISVAGVLKVVKWTT